MEHFSGNPFQHLGREVPQNTIDAKAGNPALISIALKKVAPSEIPDLDALEDVLARCGEAAQLDQNEKSIKFFKNAEALLKKKEIAVLQISDSNTLGVKGPCINGKPFFALLKATGQSRKAETSTGSYGIGKFAPFTVSELRTVFVTTVWQDDGGGWQHYVQGKSVLMSHQDSNGKTRRGTGFWGMKDGCMPIEGVTAAVPKWLQRTNDDGTIAGLAGTTLSIVGFDSAKGWEDILAANILMNFFGAIKRGELEINIEKSHQINSATLPKLLTNPSLIKVADDQEGETGKLQTVQSYLDALDGGEGVAVENTQNLHLGDCQVRILVGEKLPKKVAVLRNGMLITENMQSLKRFGEFKDFVAVLECTSTKGQALLRGMEPPRHDAFEPDRLPPDRRQQGRTALREIAKWVRDMLRRHAQDPVSEVTDLDEMADFFADESDEGAGKKKEENPAGAIIIRARPIKRKSKPTSYQKNPDNLDNIDDEGFESPANENPQGENEGAGEGGTGGGSRNEAAGGDSAGQKGGGGNSRQTSTTALPIRDVRAIPMKGGARRIAFTPLSDGVARIRLQDSGADTNRPLKVMKASIGTIEQGAIEGLKLVAGQRVIVEVDLEEEFNGTVRVVTDAV